MMAGTVFDAYVKCALDRRINLERLINNLNAEDPVMEQQALDVGHRLFLLYQDSGMLGALEEEGVAMVEIEKEVVLGNGVPIYGKPDAVMTDGRILDWKVNGVGSKYGASPKQGYIRRVQHNAKGFLSKEAHAKADQPLESLYRPWALQTTVYALLLGHKIGKPLRAGIEQIAVRGNTVNFSSFRNSISPEFQREVEERYNEIWDTLQEDMIPLPYYSDYKCNMYGRVCEGAKFCDAYTQAAIMRTEGALWKSLL